MSQFQNNRPAAKSNALKDSKLKLYGPAHEKATLRNGVPIPPTAQWSVRDNQPRITVYTGVEGDKQDGKIEAAMDLPTASAVFEAIRIYADGGEVDGKPVVGITCRGYLWTGKGKSEKPMVLATIYVGRNRDGNVFLSIVSSDASRPKIVFPILPTEWHGAVDTNGETIDNKAVSRLYAKGYANMIEGILQQIVVIEHISWQEQQERRNKNNGQSGNGNSGGGGYGNNNRGGGGYGNNGGNQRSSSPAPSDNGFDEEIPF